MKMFLEAQNLDREVPVVVLLEDNPETTSKAAGLIKKMRDLQEALVAEVTSEELREPVGEEAPEVAGVKDLFPRGGTLTLTSTPLPGAVALDKRLKLLIDLPEEVTEATKIDLALKAELLMLEEDVALITKLEVATREAGVLSNLEVVEVLNPVGVVTINSLEAEENDLLMTAMAEVVLNLENTEVEEVTKAEAEVKI
jgi:hypothetical protein